ncbi:hypothetical protein [Streptomyces sp. NPDC126503]|uniref:hypothetical protein n=1 Tax=Streptomyces sp. NPDC126503 TaxID=3155315 RepID=UPI0033207D75
MTTWHEGRRVKLAADLRLAGTLVPAGGHAEEETEAPAGTLFLAAGAEGTVVRAEEHRAEPGPEVREYERLKALLDDFGHQMPPASRERLVAEVASLEPAWTAYRTAARRVRVRVRLDNGFVLGDARADLFTPA